MENTNVFVSEKRKSLYSTLVRTIITNEMENQVFEFSDTLQDMLQNKLDSILKFETKVTNVKNIEHETFGQVYFKNEEGVAMVVDFTIAQNNLIPETML